MKTFLDKILDEKGIPEGEYHCVYHLTEGGKVVYVGQSSSPRKRIAYHCHHSDKEFDDFHLFGCSESQMSLNEAKDIVRLKPKYNKTIPNNGAFLKKAHVEKLITSQCKSLIENIDTIYSYKDDKGSYEYYSKADVELLLSRIEDFNESLKSHEVKAGE